METKPTSIPRGVVRMVNDDGTSEDNTTDIQAVAGQGSPEYLDQVNKGLNANPANQVDEQPKVTAWLMLKLLVASPLLMLTGLLDLLTANNLGITSALVNKIDSTNALGQTASNRASAPSSTSANSDSTVPEASASAPTPKPDAPKSKSNKDEEKDNKKNAEHADKYFDYLGHRSTDLREALTDSASRARATGSAVYSAPAATVAAVKAVPAAAVGTMTALVDTISQPFAAVYDSLGKVNAMLGRSQSEKESPENKSKATPEQEAEAHQGPSTGRSA